MALISKKIQLKKEIFISLKMNLLTPFSFCLRSLPFLQIFRSIFGDKNLKIIRLLPGRPLLRGGLRLAAWCLSTRGRTF